MAGLAVERRDQQGGQGQEAGKRRRLYPAHEGVELVQRHHAEHEQAEREDLTAGQDDEQGEEDRRDRKQNARPQVSSPAPRAFDVFAVQVLRPRRLPGIAPSGGHR